MDTTYLGPSDVFILNGREYRPGEKITISKESAEHHTLNGHRFEGIDPEPIIGRAQPPTAEVQAHGDAGEVLTSARSSSAHSPTPAPVTTASTDK